MRKRMLSILLFTALPVAPCKAGEQADAWSWQATLTPRAFLAEGLWSDIFRLREAMHEVGLPYDAGYKSRSSYWQPRDRIIGMSQDAEAFASYSVIVLSNLDAVSLTPARIEIIRRFVEHGGGLVVLGGYWAYARGAYNDTPLAEILPVAMPKEPRIPPHREGVLLEPARAATWEMKYDFSVRPLAFYVQTLVPKPGAAVQLLAGNRPAIISGTWGKGRVVAVALTANGTAPEGKLAYWNWPDWPKLLGCGVNWAATSRRLLPTQDEGPEREATALLSAEELDSFKLFPENVTRERISKALANLTPMVADALFAYAIRPAEAKAAKLSEILPRLTPYAKPAWQEDLARVCDPFVTAEATERAAALSLYGATRAPEAVVVLKEALREQKTRCAALDGLGLCATSKAVPLVRRAYNEAWAACQSRQYAGQLDPEAVSKEAGPTASHAALALYRLGEADGLEKVLLIYRTLHLCQRIFANAGKRRVLAQDMQGLKRRQEIWEGAKRLKESVTFLHEKLTLVPDAQRETLIRAAVNTTDPATALLLSDVIEHARAQLSTAHLLPLRKARDGILRRLGNALTGR